MEPIRIEAGTLRKSLAATLDAVLSGQSFIVTRHGREIAQLVPTEITTTGIDHSTGQGKLLDRIRRADS